MTIVSMKGVNIWRGKSHILHDINWSLDQGMCMALIGANGAGKTTLLYTLLGLLPLSNGNIVLQNNTRENWRRQIGYSGDKSILYEFYTAWEHIELWGAIRKLNTDTIYVYGRRLLAMFGLDSVQDKKVSTYSHGMQHKLSLALSLLHSPCIIIWDEPMQGLDPQTRYLVSDIIRELYHEGKTVLFSTHYLHDITELASHVTVMDRGHIVDNTAVNSIHADFSVYFQDLVIG